MQVINTILISVLFVILTILFIMLLNAYKHIKVLESKKLDAEQRAEYHAEQLKARAGLDDGKGFNFEENRCVCCGRIIPEGRDVCINCEKKEQQNER